MSEQIQPSEVWKTKHLPHLGGNKKHFEWQKIELFIAQKFAHKWEPLSRFFYPKPPLHGKSRVEYWETRYRVRVNGSWYGDKAKYHTFTKEQIFTKLMR